MKLIPCPDCGKIVSQRFPLHECKANKLDVEPKRINCPKCGGLEHTRTNFDYFAQCGVYVCQFCNRAHYPMELDDKACPDCGGNVKKTTFKHYFNGWDHACHHCGLVFDEVKSEASTVDGIYLATRLLS